MKNFIANIPLFIGLGFKLVGDSCVGLSFKLHISLKTEAGQKLAELQKVTDEIIAAIKAKKSAEQSEDRKLVDIIGGGVGGRATFAATKKPDDNT